MWRKWLACAALAFLTLASAEEILQHGHHGGNVKLIPPLKSRDMIGDLLQKEGFTHGAELGVLHGHFARAVLKDWPACMKYVLVDAWSYIPFYDLDTSTINNKDPSVGDKRMNDAIAYLSAYKDKIEVCRNFTTECAKNYKDGYFHYIYVDARHDYKGVSVDLEDWWPKLKPGGIFAGHDYVTQDDGPTQSGQNWTVNSDGTVDKTGRAVKGAVDDFAAKVNRQLVITYRENSWNTWMMRK